MAKIKIYDTSNISSSGSRFFKLLREQFYSSYRELDEKPLKEIILFNISAPLLKIVRSRILGRKIVLRVDGLYHDEISEEFMTTFKWPTRYIIKLLNRFTNEKGTHIANLINGNYAHFVKILLADYLIYQSEYSKLVHSCYFTNKPNKVVLNGARYKGHPRSYTEDEPVRLCTIFGGFRVSKRTEDMIRFVDWAKEIMKIELTIIGYPIGKNSITGLSSNVQRIAQNSPAIKLVPPFDEFTNQIEKIFEDSHIYLTFTMYDPCPNAVIEGLSFGLPVLGLKSGGLPEIVGNAGVLIDISDSNTFFKSFRFGNSLPQIDYHLVKDGIYEIMSNYNYYQVKVKERFEEELEISEVCKRYKDAIYSCLSR